MTRDSGLMFTASRTCASIRSWICVPLVARGRTLGAISFVCAGPGRHYDDDDLRLAEELARHAAIAVDNSLLFEAERDARRATEEVARQITLLQGLTAALSEALKLVIASLKTRAGSGFSAR